MNLNPRALNTLIGTSEITTRQIICRDEFCDLLTSRRRLTRHSEGNRDFCGLLDQDDGTLFLYAEREMTSVNS